MTYAILALIAVTILVIVMVAMKFDEQKRYVEKAKPEMQAAYLDLLSARLRNKSIEIGEDGQATGTGVESEATGVVVAFLLVLVCAAFGMHFLTIFFLACYGAALHQFAENLMNVGLVTFINSALNPSASTTQAA